MHFRPTRILLSAVRAAVAACVLGMASPNAQDTVFRLPDPEQQVAALVEAARDLPFIVDGHLAVARELAHPIPRELVLRNRLAIQAARALGGQPQRLADLLEHDDPKVRLMAAFGLYQLADARWLPMLGELAGDEGRVPSRLQLLGALNYEEVERWHREHPGRESTTVGREVSGWLVGWDAPSPPRGAAFDAWCTRQRELAPTAACLRVKLRIATHGVGSTSRWEPQPLLDVMYAAARAPRGSAEIALLWDKYHDMRGVFPEIESSLEFAARRVGRENVLRLLEREPPVIDGAPLDPMSYAGFEDGFARFVLERPGRIGLTPADADALLELGRANRGLPFFRAAARLRPPDALPILREALARPVDHVVGLDFAECALLLWDLQPEEGADLLVEWFHADSDGRPKVFPSHRQGFAVHLLTRYTASARSMFARLCADPRFDATPPGALEAILRVLNSAQLDPVVSEDELSGLLHPLGVDRAFGDLAAAADAHPDATGTLVATLATWRQAIREHVQAWR